MTTCSEDMQIITIYGKAGCGKTTMLADNILNDKSDYMVLAPTNSAVKTIYNVCLERHANGKRDSKGDGNANVNQFTHAYEQEKENKSHSSLISNRKKIDLTTFRSKFKTIYSYFRIDYVNDVVLGAVDMAETIYIDEFSLMNKYLFKDCLNDMRRKGCKKLVLCGDAMQLNAVYKTKQSISFNKINKLNDVNTKLLGKLNKGVNKEVNKEVNVKVDDSKVEYLPTKVLEHIHLSVFGMKCVQNGKLINIRGNKRSNTTVANTLTNIYSRNVDGNFTFVTLHDVPKYILNHGYVFIASKYAILQKVYDYIHDNYWTGKILKNASTLQSTSTTFKNDIIHIKQGISFSSGFKDLYLYPGMQIVVCDTDEHKRYVNGDILTFTGNFENDKMKCLNENNEYVYVSKIKEVDKTKSEEFYPVCPSFLLTIHKSQGKTIDNVIVCVDEMFDVSMMYTAITRAKENLIFYSKEVEREKRYNTLFKNAYIDEFKKLNMMCEYAEEVKKL